MGISYDMSIRAFGFIDKLECWKNHENEFPMGLEVVLAFVQHSFRVYASMLRKIKHPCC